MRLLGKYKSQPLTVLDPFCGRGTTIYAARKLGLPSFGLDTSPIAAAIARAKLASADTDAVIQLAKKFIARPPRYIPDTPFFRLAFSQATLAEVCSLREGLLAAKESSASAILRAAALGCLHGPMAINAESQSYFSNQMPRTFASKPDYSVRFWERRDLHPPKVSVIQVLKRKLERISDLNSESPSKMSSVKCRDARQATSYRGLSGATITITSPPYYGMRTYVQDQWLRMWFLGGTEQIDYENHDQLNHGGHDRFIADLSKVWKNIHKQSSDESHLYVRFGTIPSAKSDAKHILRASLEEAGNWKLISVRNAKTSDSGKRQADQMGRESDPASEYDFHAVLN